MERQISRAAARTRVPRVTPATAIPPFQRFVDEHRAAVYRVARAMVGPAEADDVFQETFIAAYRAYPRLQPGGDLRSWVLTIATRKAIDAGRSRSRRAIPTDELPEAAARTQDPLDGMPELWRAVRELPPKQRAAVVHRYVHDLSYADVARLIGSSEESARANAYQGVRKLRQIWEAS
jgi:RNA polymerase sigma factor (sigma-70 family)